jgi:hypothetical protein
MLNSLGNLMGFRIRTAALLLIALTACDSGYAPNVAYTDPMTGATSQVYATYLAIQLDPDYDWQSADFREDSALQSFITAERVKVIQWWMPSPTSRGPGLTVAIPRGVSLEEAVTRWKDQYAELLNDVQPIPVSSYDPAFVAP